LRKGAVTGALFIYANRIGAAFAVSDAAISFLQYFGAIRIVLNLSVNPRLVQLASYSSWYPQFGAFGSHFRSDLEISVPQGWTAVSGGAKRDVVAHGVRTVTHWSVADNFDLVISAAPNFRVTERRAGDMAIEIYHTQMPDAVVAHEADQVAAVMTLFKDRLGEAPVPGSTIRHIYLPMKHGQGRAGIARAGEIVTSEGRVLEAMEGNPSYTLFQDVAHEIAHFWWNFGSGQGDWINEAFAEYFSALAVREIESNAKFDGILERYRKGVTALPINAPSLATVSKEGGDMVWTIRYQKGALMLNAVHQAMGDASFIKTAGDFFQTYEGKSIGTVEFCTFWRERLGDKKAVLDAWLDSSGSIPISQ
jgi:aminopeptidase N